MSNDHTRHMDELVPPPPPKDNARMDIPASPISPPSLPGPMDEKGKKNSPLTDLIHSERVYVELLAGIIRKVAAAWSRSNHPPPELDGMFRSVEGVYKTNRTLLARLNEIGEYPSSPKVLGDLLMRWIDDLERPYTTYTERYCIGFDGWEPVKTNTKLPIILQAFSASNPLPPTSLQSALSLNHSLWTLDTLFLLPKGRLQYYRKLYSRLLKGTTPGRSDHKLLIGALEKLNALLATLDERANIDVSNLDLGPSQIQTFLTNAGANPMSVIPMEPLLSEPIEATALLSGKFGVDSPSAEASLRDSLSSRDEHLEHDTTLVLVGRESSQTIVSIFDLERRLVTENTLDLFTMQPKQIRLQITPPNLTYSRELRLSAKVLVRFTPNATGVEVIHRHGHIYILSDLFLLCEEMGRGAGTTRGNDGGDLHLCYPPLSGKVLNVTRVPGQDNALEVSIMRKETLVLEVDSILERDRIFDEFQECIIFAKTISRVTQGPVPLLPAVGNSRTKERPDRALNPRLLPHPQSDNVLSDLTDFSPSLDRTSSASSPKYNSGSSSMSSFSQYHLELQNAALAQPQTMQGSRHGSPQSSPALSSNEHQLSISHNPGLVHPQHVSSPGSTDNGLPSSFIPDKIVPPIRGASLRSQSPPDRSIGPGSVFPPLVSPASQIPNLRHHTSIHSLRQQPLEYQLSLRSLPHRPNHPTFALPHPQPTLHTSGKQPVSAHPSNPSLASRPVEQSLNTLRGPPSSRSLRTQYQVDRTPTPPIPLLPDGSLQRPPDLRKDSVGSSNTSMSRLLPPSIQMGSRTNSVVEPSILDPSPPTSPVQERKLLGPVQSVVTAQMRCKVFHQQHHAQWKSLGSANLTLYRQDPTNVKQLVVEAGNKERSILISTIVLTDGVERVGKTGVAIELSNAAGARTGVIYMIQLRDEDSASNLFRNLLAGSDRAM